MKSLFWSAWFIACGTFSYLTQQYLLAMLNTFLLGMELHSVLFQRHIDKAWKLCDDWKKLCEEQHTAAKENHEGWKRSFDQLMDLFQEKGQLVRLPPAVKDKVSN